MLALVTLPSVEAVRPRPFAVLVRDGGRPSTTSGVWSATINGYALDERDRSAPLPVVLRCSPAPALRRAERWYPSRLGSRHATGQAVDSQVSTRPISPAVPRPGRSMEATTAVVRLQAGTIHHRGVHVREALGALDLLTRSSQAPRQVRVRTRRDRLAVEDLPRPDLMGGVCLRCGLRSLRSLRCAVPASFGGSLVANAGRCLRSGSRAVVRATWWTLPASPGPSSWRGLLILSRRPRRASWSWAVPGGVRWSRTLCGIGCSARTFLRIGRLSVGSGLLVGSRCGPILRAVVGGSLSPLLVCFGMWLMLRSRLTAPRLAGASIALIAAAVWLVVLSTTTVTASSVAMKLRLRVWSRRCGLPGSCGSIGSMLAMRKR